jgi:SAM-dependent methyltransferase
MQDRSPERDLTTASFWSQVWSEGEPRDGSSGRIARWTDRLRDRLVRELLDRSCPDGTDVLELGCAPGAMLELIHRLRGDLRLHGVDFSELGVAATRARFAPRGIGVTVHHDDLRRFDPPCRYDAVLSFGLVEHFEEPLDVVAHHVRLAKPGGVVVIVMPNYAAPLVEYFIRRFDPPALQTHNLATMRPERLCELLRDAGLGDVEVGAAGGSKLRSVASVPGGAALAFRIGARAWNVTGGGLPLSFGWQSLLWGMGRMPRGGPPSPRETRPGPP